MLRLLRGRVGPDLTLIGVGGITTADDARARLDAGATLLQGYTAFIYEGPAVAAPDPARESARSDDRSAPASHAAIADRGPFCVGIDPHAALLHDWGLDDDVAGLETFALTVVEAVAPYVSVVKPQSAFFERFGSRGHRGARAGGRASRRAAGALVLLDVKRGDIGSTRRRTPTPTSTRPRRSPSTRSRPARTSASARSTRWSTPRAKHDAGVFVLALTSNKEGAEVQHARDRPTARTVARPDARRTCASSTPAPAPLGSFGAVVGATIGDAGGSTSTFNGPILAPGYGAQGGTAADIGRIFGAAARHVAAELVARACCGSVPTAARCATPSRRANDELRGLTG